MTKLTKIISLTLIVGVLLFLCYGYFPVKFALKERNVISSENKILCRTQKVTGFDWMMLIEVDGETKAVDIRIEGKSPFKELGAEVLYGENTFVLYGEFVGEGVFGETERYRIFRCDKWDILYPIRRPMSLFDAFLPIGILCRFDLIW